MISWHRKGQKVICKHTPNKSWLPDVFDADLPQEGGEYTIFEIIIARKDDYCFGVRPDVGAVNFILEELADQRVAFSCDFFSPVYPQEVEELRRLCEGVPGLLEAVE